LPLFESELKADVINPYVKLNNS